MNNVKGRDLDYILLNKKKFIGCFVVHMSVGNAADRLMDVGQITEITGNDVMFIMKVDGNSWMLYGWDVILPQVSEDETSITVLDKICDIKWIILKKDNK